METDSLGTPLRPAGTGSSSGSSGGFSGRGHMRPGGAGAGSADYLTNAVNIEILFPPHVPFVPPTTIREKFASWGLSTAANYAQKVCRGFYKIYKAEGRVGARELITRMSQFQDYDAKQQDMFLGYYFLAVSDIIGEVKRDVPRYNDEDLQDVVRCTVPPLMADTNMGLVTAMAYAARTSNGADIMKALNKESTYDHVFDERRMGRNIFDGVDYSAATTLIMQETVCVEGVDVGGCDRGKSRSINVHSPLFIAAVRANYPVVEYLCDTLGLRGNEPSIGGTTPLAAREAAYAMAVRVEQDKNTDSKKRQKLVEYKERSSACKVLMTRPAMAAGGGRAGHGYGGGSGGGYPAGPTCAPGTRSVAHREYDDYGKRFGGCHGPAGSGDLDDIFIEDDYTGYNPDADYGRSSGGGSSSSSGSRSSSKSKAKSSSSSTSTSKSGSGAVPPMSSYERRSKAPERDSDRMSDRSRDRRSDTSRSRGRSPDSRASKDRRGADYPRPPPDDSY